MGYLDYFFLLLLFKSSTMLSKKFPNLDQFSSGQRKWEKRQWFRCPQGASAYILCSHGVGVLLASSRLRPRMRLNILQGTGPPPHNKKSYPKYQWCEGWETCVRGFFSKFHQYNCVPVCSVPGAAPDSYDHVGAESSRLCRSPHLYNLLFRVHRAIWHIPWFPSISGRIGAYKQRKQGSSLGEERRLKVIKNAFS